MTSGENLKPRNAKPPLHLLPWDVLPLEMAPPDIVAVVTDARVTYGEAFMFLMSQRLVKRAGLADVAAAFGYGAGRYAPENWRENSDRQGDYAGALCRHLVAEHGGEAVDPESGVPHVAHAAASALIWLWHERRREAPVVKPGEPVEEWSYFRSAADAEECAAEARAHGDVVWVGEPPPGGLRRWSVRVVRFGAKEG